LAQAKYKRSLEYFLAPEREKDASNSGDMPQGDRIIMGIGECEHQNQRIEFIMNRC
jgi:hypothetical protein